MRRVPSFCLSVVSALLTIAIGIPLSASAQQSVAALPSRLLVVPGLEEPLLTTGPTAPAEDKALEAAVADFRGGDPRLDFAARARPLEEFLGRYPHSAWRLAVLTDLGSGYYRAGYFTKAMSAWEAGWNSLALVLSACAGYVPATTWTAMRSS